jgi:hypothetical protein
MKRHLVVFFALSLFAFIFLLAGSHADAANVCFPAIGKFESTILPSGQCDTNICTKGALIGSPFGDYEYRGEKLFPADDTAVPGVMFYTGKSVVHTRKGELYLTDTGALDMTTGSMSALLTVTGGTNEYAKATGYLHVHGTADLKTGLAKGDFEGQMCKPQ